MSVLREEGEAMIEFDVDMGYLLEDDELDCVILHDESGKHEPMEFVPKAGNGTCEFELNTDMTAIRCDKCGYELPKGTDLKATRFCGGCGRRVR